MVDPFYRPLTCYYALPPGGDVELSWSRFFPKYGVWGYDKPLDVHLWLLLTDSQEEAVDFYCDENSGALLFYDDGYLV